MGADTGAIWPYILAAILIVPMECFVVYMIWRFNFRLFKSDWDSRSTPRARRNFLMMVGISIIIPIAIAVLMARYFP